MFAIVNIDQSLILQLVISKNDFSVVFWYTLTAWNAALLFAIIVFNQYILSFFAMLLLYLSFYTRRTVFYENWTKFHYLSVFLT